MQHEVCRHLLLRAAPDTHRDESLPIVGQTSHHKILKKNQFFC